MELGSRFIGGRVKQKKCLQLKNKAIIALTK